MYRLINWVFDQINKRSPIIFQTPNHKSFGNGAEEMFFGLLKAKRKNKKILFVYPRLSLFGKAISVANREMFHLESDLLVPNESIYGLVGGWLLSLYLVALYALYLVRSSRKICAVVRLFSPEMARQLATHDFSYIVSTVGKSMLWKPDGVHFFSWRVVEEQNWKPQFEAYSSPRLRDNKRRLAERIRLDMGIPLDDWFVCLHASEEHPPGVRNASIHHYIDGIKAITAVGGWVVRLGGATMTPLPLMERVVDYAHSTHKSSLMDMYLMSQCRFFIGLASGPTFVATLFRKPQVLVNMTDWSMGMPLYEGSLIITKHVFSRSRNRFLSIQEILEEPYQVHIFDLTSDEYVLVENTPAEIREVIEEFLSQRHPYPYNSFQEAFNECRKRQMRCWVEQGEPRWYGVPERDIFIGQYRLISRMEAGGTLGQKYLEKNWDIDAFETRSRVTTCA